VSRERLFLFDTTLRDGAQTMGVDFSVEDKRQIALALDALGLDYIEGGWPGANPTDTEFFAARPPLKSARFTAFGMTKRAGRSAANDPSLAAVMNAAADAVCLVGKTSAYQVEVALGISRAENIDNIAQSIAAIAEKKREPLFDAEHFFDGWRADRDYAFACIRAAHEAGAAWIVLCDTNGGVMPEEAYGIVSAVKERLPQAALGIHAHNDTEQAVAVSLAALRAGVRQIQGTLNGLGERCGNANLCSLIPNLMLKEPYASQFETGVSPQQLARITQVSRLLDEILNRAPARHAPYVGPSAFAHKGGLHSSAVLKDPATYEHVKPESVGNERVIPVSDQAGRSNVLARLAEAGIAIDSADPRVARLLEDIKRRAASGYAYDGAEASFELLARRALGQVPEYFTVKRYIVTVERDPRHEKRKVLSICNVEVEVDGVTYQNTGEGNGPVNALDAALRADLGKYSGLLADLRLVDYKVRILSTGTEAVTRVMVESADGQGRRWSSW
jgi:2-isopropylmalate synthase